MLPTWRTSQVVPWVMDSLQPGLLQASSYRRPLELALSFSQVRVHLHLHMAEIFHLPLTSHDLLPHTIWSYWNDSDLCGMGWTCTYLTYLTTRALLEQCRVKHIKVPSIKVTSSRRRWWIPKGESPDPSLLEQLRATFRTGWNWGWCCKKIKSTNDIVSLWRIISKLLIMIEDL